MGTSAQTEPGSLMEPSVRVLGDFRFRKTDGEVVAPTRQMARLGAALAATPQVSVNSDELIAILWGDTPPRTAANALQVHVSQFRDLCGPEAITTTSSGYLLDVPPDAIDAGVFERAVPDAEDALEAGDTARAGAFASSALALWCGVPFAGLDHSSISARRMQLTELHETARELELEIKWLRADTRATRSTVVAEFKGLVVQQPLRERGYELLIRALVAEDRMPEAGAVFQSAARIFDEQAGSKPSPRLAAALGSEERSGPSDD